MRCCVTTMCYDDRRSTMRDVDRTASGGCGGEDAAAGQISGALLLMLIAVNGARELFVHCLAGGGLRTGGGERQ